MAYYIWSSDTPRVRHGTGERIQPGEHFEPTDHELRAFRHCMEPVETCREVKDDGEVCGRDLPCRYHTDDK